MTKPQFSQPDDPRPLVVVVDDEPALRRLMGAALQQHFRVLLAADGSEALALYKLAGLGIAAVVTDIRMPGMDGLALAAALRDLGATIPILFVSGYSVIGEAPAPFLPKPFPPDDLLASVQALLRGAALTEGRNDGRTEGPAHQPSFAALDLPTIRPSG